MKRIIISDELEMEIHEIENCKVTLGLWCTCEPVMSYADLTKEDLDKMIKVLKEIKEQL